MNLAIARVFVIMKTAEILDQTVEYLGDPAERATTNWREAERLADANLYAVHHVARALTDEDSYRSFEVKIGQQVWHMIQPWRRSLPTPPLRQDYIQLKNDQLTTA